MLIILHYQHLQQQLMINLNQLSLIFETTITYTRAIRRRVVAAVRVLRFLLDFNHLGATINWHLSLLSLNPLSGGRPPSSRLAIRRGRGLGRGRHSTVHLLSCTAVSFHAGSQVEVFRKRISGLALPANQLRRLGFSYGRFGQLIIEQSNRPLQPASSASALDAAP